MDRTIVSEIRFGLVYFHLRWKHFAGKFFMARESGLIDTIAAEFSGSVLLSKNNSLFNGLRFSLLPSVIRYGICCLGPLNDIVFNQKITSLEMLLDLMKTRLEVWAKVCWPHLHVLDVFTSYNIIDISGCRKRVPKYVEWQKPDLGSVKFNVDGSSIEKPRPASIELMRFSKSNGVEKSNVAELLAIREGLILFISSPWVQDNDLIMESVSKIAIGWIL
ncbi:hypothetical protein PTKIN_Ptkin08bG0142300 [Pterospermum kingtungense]